MRNFIRKLQSKPERERRKILLLSTISITVIIFVFWVASFRNNFSDTSVANKTVETSPFSILKTSLGNAYSGFNSTDQNSPSSNNVSATDTSSQASETSVTGY